MKFNLLLALFGFSAAFNVGIAAAPSAAAGAAAGAAPTAGAAPSAGAAFAAGDDPFLWLEQAHGKRAMQWVKAENVKTDAVL